MKEIALSMTAGSKILAMTSHAAPVIIIMLKKLIKNRLHLLILLKLHIRRNALMNGAIVNVIHIFSMVVKIKTVRSTEPRNSLENLLMPVV
jgi:hypothetical protein